MNRKIFLGIILIVLILLNNISAQFSIDSEIRPRFEFRDGYKTSKCYNTTPAFIISQRSRISFCYTTDKLQIKFTPQDVRVWGDEQLASSTGVYGDHASMDIYEAFAKINFTASFYIKTGRQEFAYNYERLLAKRNWNQNGLTYDAVLFAYEKNKLKIHLASSWNSLNAATSNNFYLPNRIKSLSFLWINKNFSDNFNIALFHISMGVTETDSTNTLRFKQTTGIYSKYKSEELNYKANAYFQYGKNNNNQSVSAYLFDANLYYKINKFKIGAGTSLLSGDNNTGDNTDKLFDILYGARHKYFGHIDYFGNIPSSTKKGGLTDLFGYIGFKPTKTIEFTNTGHFLSLNKTNNLTPKNKNLGYENEIEFKYKLSQNINIKTAYLFYIPSENFKQLFNSKTSNFQQFAFIEITFNPTIFTNQL